MLGRLSCGRAGLKVYQYRRDKVYHPEAQPLFYRHFIHESLDFFNLRHKKTPLGLKGSLI